MKPLTARYENLYNAGEITLEKAIEYSKEVFDLLEEDKQGREVSKLKKKIAFEKAQKEHGITDRMILQVIHTLRTGIRMSKATKKALPKVQALFNEQFRSCKNGKVFSWNEYFKIYEMDL